jgi:glycosyltransferase involved in cell wall biosynthesis
MIDGKLSKIKIGYVIDTIATSSAGTEKQLLMLLRGLDREIFEPWLICLRPAPWLNDLKADFEMTIFDFKSLSRPKALYQLRKMIRFFKQKRFDIIQTFFVDANIIGTIAARMAGCQTLISSRRNIGYWHTSFHRMWLKLLGRWTDYYLGNSEAIVRMTIDAEAARPEKVKVIYNGLDLEVFKNIPNDEGAVLRQKWGVSENDILIGMAANLRPVKNIESFINAAMKLVNQYNNLKFVVIGEGSERNKYEQMIGVEGLKKRFLLPGRHNDIRPCLAAFDMAVSCSHSESFSNSIIEYMAAGLPVAASAVGGTPEAIIDGQTGVLFDINDPNGVTSALKKLIDNIDTAREMGMRARKKAFTEYSREVMIERHEEFYKGVITKNGRD